MSKNKIEIDADNKEMAYIIGLFIVDYLGISPSRLVFEDQEEFEWNTQKAIEIVSGFESG